MRKFLLSGLLVAYTLPQTLDAVSSEVAFSRGSYEQNPLMKERSVRLLSKAAVGIIMYKLDQQLVERKKTRWGFRIAYFGLYGYVIHRNLRQNRTNND